jgi:hypothetical protein
VQELHYSWFNSLRKDDVLFIDSTHVVKIGGDVVYPYLEVLSRLNSGVLVHAHDIFLPLEHPRGLGPRGARVLERAAPPTSAVSRMVKILEKLGLLGSVGLEVG